MEMQGVLGVGIGSNENAIVSRPPKLTKIGPQIWSRLCGLICAYCLADVVALLGGCKLSDSQLAPNPIPLIKQPYVTFPDQFIPINGKV